jgi:rod shape determining protein RodA
MKHSFFKTFYFPLFLFAIILAAIGLTNLYSATTTIETQGASTFFQAQMIYTCIGIVVMLILCFVNINVLYKMAPLIYVMTLGLLVLVLVMGSKSHGSMSWLDLGFVRLQPSELAKFGMVIMLARYFSSLQKDGPLNMRELLISSIFFLIPTVLVILQNDLGSSLFYGFIFGSIVLIQGLRLRFIIIGAILICIIAILGFNFFLKDHHKNRIQSFMEPELDPKGTGYHLVQSKIAVGSGRAFGRGYLKGQSHRLKFLPERHTDFVFPVLAEEWGFAGAAITLIFYFFFLISGINIALYSETRFGFFLAIGIVATFFWHLVINLGGVLGLLPLTGVPLPFLSYGGSSLVANWMAMGFLLSIFRSGFKRH